MHRFYYVADRHYTYSLAIMNEALTDLANAGVRYNLRSGTKSLCPRFIYNKTVDFMTLNGRLQRTRVRSRVINRILLIGQ